MVLFIEKVGKGADLDLGLLASCEVFDLYGAVFKLAAAHNYDVAIALLEGVVDLLAEFLRTEIECAGGACFAN